jgi:hypothetical protein
MGWGVRCWRGTGDYWTAIGGGDRLFYYCTQTENINLLKKLVVSECTTRMFNGG